MMERLSARIWLRRSQQGAADLGGFRSNGGGLRCGFEGPRRRGGCRRRWEGGIRRFGACGLLDLLEEAKGMFCPVG